MAQDSAIGISQFSHLSNEEFGLISKIKDKSSKITRAISYLAKILLIQKYNTLTLDRKCCCVDNIHLKKKLASSVVTGDFRNYVIFSGQLNKHFFSLVRHWGHRHAFNHSTNIWGDNIWINTQVLCLGRENRRGEDPKKCGTLEECEEYKKGHNL